MFIDDKPLTKVLSKDASRRAMKFYIDYAGGKIYLADDPTNHKVEATVASFAFESTAADVSISNLTSRNMGAVRKKERSTPVKAPDGPSRTA